MHCRICLGIILMTTWLLCATSCGSHEGNVGLTCLSINPSDAVQRELAEVMTDIQVVQLEGGDSMLIGEISDMIVGKQYIYILDRGTKSVFIYNQQGRFVNQIASYGQGPEEYLSLSTIYLSRKQDNLVLVDNQKKVSLVYDLQGRFIRTEKNDFAIKSTDYLSDGTRIVVRDIVDGTDRTGYVVNIYEREEQPRTYFPFTYRNGSTIFEKYRLVTAVDDEFYYNALRSDTIFEYSNRQLAPRYIVDFLGKGIPKEISRLSPDKFSDEFIHLITDKSRRVACWLSILDKTDNQFVLAYLWGNETCYCIYDVQQDRSRQFMGPSLNGVNMSEIVLSQFYLNHTMYFVLDSYKVSQLSTEKLNLIASRYPDIYARIRQQEPSDNPIIITARLKF